MASSDDSTLIKVAIWGITVSVVASLMISILLVPSGDYDLDEINSYRDDLGGFTGESMISATPWVLTGVYTPWTPSMGTSGHIDDDGWLYGQGWNVNNAASAPASIKDQLGKAANIYLDESQKSSVPLSINQKKETYTYVSNVSWWADNPTGTFLDDLLYGLGVGLHLNPYETSEGQASRWNYTGYRYTFDPTLPFAASDGTQSVSTRDGTLSIVWYSYGSQEGISGGLQIYGGDVLLSNITAAELVSGYETTSGYATTYDFVFDGAHLNLLLRFDPEVLERGMPLMQAFAQGDWSMAITSVSAGNFYDLQNSNSFVTTTGNMIDTFVDIFTFSVPSINDPLMDLVLWLIVGLPMMIALLCVTLRIINSVRLI